MPEITIIGAGSTVFGKRLIGDILSFPELAHSTIRLMDIDEDRLDLTTSVAETMIENGAVDATVRATTNRRKALQGADYVITTIDVGGLEPFENEITISEKYGLEIASGGTLNPSGIFHGFRNMPVVLSIAQDMEDLCPEAVLINHTNPMAPICWSVDKATDIDIYGFCHSVPHTTEALAEYVDVDPEEIDHWVAGINHMAWYLTFKRNGEDLYPALTDAMANPEIYERDAVRFEVFDHFGKFVTESSRHMSEYVPYFRTDDQLIEELGVPSGWWIEKKREDFADDSYGFEFDADEIQPERSGEYTALFIHSLETGERRRFNLNVRNDSELIRNLPSNACVEVPVFVDGAGVHPCSVGDLPPQLAALNRSNINVQEMMVKAVLETDREAAHQAVALDPLTAAELSLDEIHDLTEELLMANDDYLPEFH